MREIGAFEAKTHLSKLLAAVQRGEEIAITKHGVRVALLIPPPSASDHAKKAVENFRRWREGITWGKAMNTQKAKEEGRR
ncbi:MAG: type II toxin-antitoxin system prevent-host-death family antitoxin [Gammaproteobacteria bacterium]